MEPYIGQIQTYAFQFAPRGWMLCWGQILSIAQNTTLFSLIGTTYGGNGQTTFALPDLRSRVPNGQGQGPGLSAYSMGELGGSEQVVITSLQMPQHVHPMTLGVSTQAATSTTAVAGEFLATPSGEDANLGAVTVKMYGPGPATVQLNAGSTGVAGGSQPLYIMNPFLTINYSIAVQGIFPSRN